MHLHRYSDHFSRVICHVWRLVAAVATKNVAPFEHMSDHSPGRRGPLHCKNCLRGAGRKMSEPLGGTTTMHTTSRGQTLSQEKALQQQKRKIPRISRERDDWRIKNFKEKMNRPCKLLPFSAILLTYFLLPAVNAVCRLDQFTCMDGRTCIAQVLVNNTINDCGDNSDEGAPPHAECMSRQKFKCRSGNCVSLDWYLDGRIDCGDLSDEYRVIGSRCGPTIDGCCQCNETVENSTCVPADPPYVKPDMNGVCRCMSGWRNNSLGTECIKRQIGDSCDIDSDCFDAVPNTACISGQCLCALGHYLDSNDANLCIRRKINDTCEEQIDCSMAVNESSCVSNLCHCNQGYEPTNNLAKCIIPLIDSFECRLNTDCLHHFNNTFCNSDGLCLCTSAFHPDASRRNCIRYKLNSTCSSNQGCQASMNNTICLGQRCACASGFYSASPRLCLPRTIGMDGCLTDADCAAVNQSRCWVSTGVCACQPGHLSSGDNRTCLKRRIGDQCQSVEDCVVVIAQSTCVGGMCRCEPGYRETGDSRVCVALKVGDECERDSECLTVMDESRCSEQHRCVCSEGFEATSTRSGCRRAPVHRIGCHNDSTCQSLVRNSACSSNGNCVCDKGFYPDVDGTGCALLQVGVLPCNTDDRCSKAMNSTVCSALGVCVCIPGYYPNVISNHCVNVVLDKTLCTEDDDCSSAVYKSECIRGRCQCADGYKALAGRSCVATHIGQACRTDDHCAAFIEHSVCLNQTCACAKGFNTTDDITCRPIPSDRAGDCVSPALCSVWCVVFIALFVGTLLASIVLGAILCRKKLKKSLRNRRRVVPQGMAYGMDEKWQLDWNNRPPAHIPVMYKSPSMKAPDELYGDLLNFDFNGMIFDKPQTKDPTKLPTSTV